MPKLRRLAGRRPPFRAGLLLPEGPEGEADPVGGLFPPLGKDGFRELVFQLLYAQHGGSGLTLTLSDVMDLELGDIYWLIERLGDQRRREAREIEQAGRRVRRR